MYGTEIHKQIIAKEKAKFVIDSCESKAHIDAADRYIVLYGAKFEDQLGYYELQQIKEEKYQKLINP